ncbi:MAG: molybdopterin cofactor-binding domain-containing protein, partial [Elioraea tepidiphila]
MDGDLKARNRAVGAALRHDSARKHTTGEAAYADDLPEPPGLLHAALVLSPVAHGRILDLDLSPALGVPGVVMALGPGDIPGENNISSTGRSVEPLFADGLVEHWGQTLALVLGETRDAALLGARAVQPRIAPLPPVLRIEDALERGQLLLPPMVMSRGDWQAGLAAAPARLKGEFRSGGQEHFYLEGQIAIAIPGEDGEQTIISSTQHPTEVQHIVSRVLGCDYNRVMVECRRMGGGFGGKESNASWIAAAAALAARATGRPVKLRLPRKADIAATGKRHPFLYRFEVGFDATGRVLALDATLAADGGHSLDMSGGVIMRAVTNGEDAPTAEGGWLDWLRDCGVVAIDELDTRALVQHLRDKGSMRGGIFPINIRESEARAIV